jgi:uncharacterized DUF497 family protein
MRFDWDRHNLEHIAKHGVTQEDVETAMRGRHFSAGPERAEDGEKRWIAFTAYKYMLVVYTKRKGDIRVVTAYPSREVRKRFETQRT